MIKEERRLLIEERNKNGFIDDELSETTVALLKEKLAKGQELPEGYFKLDGVYCYDGLEVLSHEERMEWIAHKQLRKINIIKNCVVFFTVLTVISLIASTLLIIFS